MKSSLIIASLLLTSFAAVAGTPAPLPPPQAPASPSGWQFRAAPYLWAQSLDGTEGVRGFTGDVDLDFGDIVEDLEFAFMGAFEARYGRWGILTDVCYSEVGDSIETRDLLLSDANFNMKQFLGNVTLSYRVVESESTVVELYGGTRLNWIDLDVDATGVGGSFFSRSGDKFWADAIIGARFQTSLGGPWFLRVAGDIGAGDSDFTWQALGLIGYKVNENCNVGIGYRGLGTDFEDGGFTYDITAHGPVLGVEWKF